MAAYLSRDQILNAFRTFAEKDYYSVALGGTVHLIEPTGAQRLDANRAALAENENEPDNLIYRAVLIASCVIDPTTRQPLLEPADALVIAQGREQAAIDLCTEILRLGEASTGDLFRGDQKVDG